MGILTGSLAAMGGLFNSVHFVAENQRAAYNRAGRYTRKHGTPQIVRMLAEANGYSGYQFPEAGDFYGIRGPGLAFSLPGTDRYVKINIGENRHGLENQTVEAKCGRQMSIGGTVVWHVMGDGVSPALALMRLNDSKTSDKITELSQTVTALTGEGISAVMDGLSVKQMRRFKERSQDIHDYCEEDLAGYGVKMLDVVFDNPQETVASRNARAVHASAEAINNVAQAIENTGSFDNNLAVLAVQALMSQNHPGGNGHGAILGDLPPIRGVS